MDIISLTLIAIIIVLQMGKGGFEISDVRQLLKKLKFSQSSLVETRSYNTNRSRFQYGSIYI